MRDAIRLEFDEQVDIALRPEVFTQGGTEDGEPSYTVLPAKGRKRGFRY